MKDLLDLQTVTWLAGVACIVLVTIIQHLSKKYKPWTWLAEQFGKAVNKEMIERLDSMDKKIEEMEKRGIAHEKETEDEKAKAARRRILRFADEIRAKMRHSKEFFDNVFEDISFYKDYCDKHDDFENEKAVMAIELIEEVYKKCYRENDFL